MKILVIGSGGKFFSIYTEELALIVRPIHPGKGDIKHCVVIHRCLGGIGLAALDQSRELLSRRFWARVAK